MVNGDGKYLFHTGFLRKKAPPPKKKKKKIENIQKCKKKFFAIFI